ncbi:hypothetical protein [Rubritalea marina]|uniref:hypothetical protein n=1 Tax=Rubritalea marina TaxID=361055 RepID=UPI00037A3D9C|nr:hypothetical protein [Rubritalea marina]
MKSLILIALLFSASVLQAGLDDDPDVVMLGEAERMPLMVVEPTVVYATKKGGRRLGVYPMQTKLTLLGMTERAYKVKGKAKHSKVTGWVSPKHLAAQEPQFVESLKQHYQREMEIRELVAKKEVAIGMTLDEVRRSIGDPTKKESRLTKEGSSGTWEYIKSEERKHYTTYRDAFSGQVFRRFSHITQEVTEKLTLEFDQDVVTTITTLEDQGAGNVRIVVPPVIFAW